MGRRGGSAETFKEAASRIQAVELQNKAPKPVTAPMSAEINRDEGNNIKESEKTDGQNDIPDMCPDVARQKRIEELRQQKLAERAAAEDGEDDEDE